MALAQVSVDDGQITVVPFGSQLLTPIVAEVRALADSAEDAVNSAVAEVVTQVEGQVAIAAGHAADAEAAADRAEDEADRAELVVSQAGLFEYAATRAAAVSAAHPDGTWVVIFADEDHDGVETINEVVSGTVTFRGYRSEKGFNYETVGDMLDDTRPYGFFSAGDIVRVLDGGFAYQVLADDADEPGMLSNAASTPVNFRFLSPDGTYPWRAFRCALDGSDDLVPAQLCADAALANNGATIGSGTLAVSSSGPAFGTGQTIGATEAGILLGEDDSYQADKKIAFRATGAGLTIKAFVQDEDATPLVVKNIGQVEVGEGVSFDGNLVTTGFANPFAFVGCGKVVLPRSLDLANFWQAEVCGMPFRQGGELQIYDVRLRNCIGASGFFAGKPYGVTDVFHTGTIYATGEDGAGSGALTVDNDPTGDDDDMSVVSATASGTTVTLETDGAHGWEVDDWIYVVGATPNQYNRGFQIATVPDTTHLTYIARKAPTSSPATGTITVRKAQPPYRQVHIDKVVAEHFADDLVLYACKVEDGVQRFWLNEVVGRDLYPATLGGGDGFKGALRIAGGNFDSPFDQGWVGKVIAEETRFGVEVQVFRADWGTLDLGLVDCTEVGIGVRVSTHSTTPDHGTISELKARVIQRGGWSEETRSLAFYVNTGGSGVWMIEELDLSVPLMQNCNSGVCAIEGVRDAKISLGRVTGGFTTADSNPLSTRNYVTDPKGTLVVLGAETIDLDVGCLQAGGSGLGSGKAGGAVFLHATERIHVTGQVLDGGEGTNQVSDAGIRLLLPDDDDDHESLCEVTIEDITFRNMPIAIIMNNPATPGLETTEGYTLTVRNCVFESTVTSVFSTTVSRFRRVRTFNCRGLLEGSQSDGGFTVNDGATSTPVEITVSGMNSSDTVHVGFDASIADAVPHWERVGGDTIRAWFESPSGGGSNVIASGAWHVRADMVRG